MLGLNIVIVRIDNMKMLITLYRRKVKEKNKNKNNKKKTDEQKRHSPVVPAGVISLKCSTTSSLSERLASLVKERIHFFSSWFGCSSEA